MFYVVEFLPEDSLENLCKALSIKIKPKIICYNGLCGRKHLLVERKVDICSTVSYLLIVIVVNLITCGLVTPLSFVFWLICKYYSNMYFLFDGKYALHQKTANQFWDALCLPMLANCECKLKCEEMSYKYRCILLSALQDYYRLWTTIVYTANVYC